MVYFQVTLCTSGFKAIPYKPYKLFGLQDVEAPSGAGRW